MKLVTKEGQDAAKLLKKDGDKRMRVFSRRDKFFRLYRDLYYFQHYGRGTPGKIDGPGGSPRTQASDATNHADYTFALLSSEELGIDVFPRIDQPGITDNLATEDVERFFAGMIQANDLRQGERVLDLAVKDATIYGWGVWYIYWDDDLANLYQVQQGDGEYFLESPPVVIERVHPWKVYPERGGPKGQFKSCLIIESLSGTEIEDKYGVILEKYKGMDEDRRGSTKSKVFTYWGWEKISEEEIAEVELVTTVPNEEGEEEEVELEPGWYIVNAISAERQMLLEPQVMQGYRHLPIVVFPFRASGEEEWDKWGVSSIFPIHTSILEKDKLQNAVSTQVYKFTNMPWFHTEPRFGGSSDIQWEEGLGQLIPLQADETVRPPDWPGNPPDVQRLWEWHQLSIKEGSYSTTSEHARSGTSGLTLARELERDTVRLTDVRKNISLGFQMMFDIMRAYIVEFAPDTPISTYARYRRTGESVQLSGQQLAPFVIVPTIEGRLKLDPIRAMMIGLQLIAAGDSNPIPSRIMMEEYFGFRQPADLLEEKRQERVDDSQFALMLGLFMQAMQEGTIPPGTPFEVVLQLMQQMGGGGAGPAGSERTPARPGSAILPGQEDQIVQRAPAEGAGPAS